VIAELAAFNAAFGVVKEFVANGRDLSDCFGFIGQMTTAKGRPEVKSWIKEALRVTLKSSLHSSKLNKLKTSLGS
jgi:hypothetical protein